MRAFTRRRLRAAVKLGLSVIPIMVGLRLAHGLPLVPGTVVLSFAMGFLVGAAELFWLRQSFRRLGFLPHLVLKSLVLVVLMYAAFLFLNILDIVLEGETWSGYLAAVSEPQVLVTLLEALGVIAFLLLVVQLDRLLGPGVLVGYVTGRYHRPRREERIFMFLDLKGSTELAEGMEPDRYFQFLHRYFSEMSEPILETDAAIYQYVGDEVVLTWPLRSGLEEANCLRAFFLIRERIQAGREHFLAEFGVEPQFKAGLHAGEVITAQIGELKSEIVYNGDVLNTTARIQAKCNELGADFLVSLELLNRLDPGPGFHIRTLGEIPLRGKAEAVGLCAVEMAPA